VYSLCIPQLEPKGELEIKTKDSFSRIYKSLLNDQAIARQWSALFSSSLRSKDDYHEGIWFTEQSGAEVTRSLKKLHFATPYHFATQYT